MQLTDLRALIRTAIADATEWPDASIDAWIREAITFYSAHFPRRWRNTMTLTTGTQAYPLPGGHGFMQLLGVQYPSTANTHLRQVNESDHAFEDAEEVYALRGQADSTAANADDAAGLIVFAQTVTTGQYAIIDYMGAHALPTVGDDDADITVPNAHLEAIVAYVDFAAQHKAHLDNVPGATDTTLLLSQLNTDARAAWNRYKDVMDRLVWLNTAPAAATAAAPNWTY